MFLQERYGHYNLTDPFLALQRDFESGLPGGDKERRAMGSSPISVLEAVMAHCRKMQERMSAQLAAAESRQKRVRPIVCCSERNTGVKHWMADCHVGVVFYYVAISNWTGHHARLSDGSVLVLFIPLCSEIKFVLKAGRIIVGM